MVLIIAVKSKLEQYLCEFSRMALNCHKICIKVTYVQNSNAAPSFLHRKSKGVVASDDAAPAEFENHP